MINNGDVLRFAGPGLTVISMAMLAELMYSSKYYIECLKKVNIYLRITFLINLMSVFLIDYTSFSKLTNVYFWGIDNRFVFTMIPWIFFEGIVSFKETRKLSKKWLYVVIACETILIYKISVAAFILVFPFILLYFLQKINFKRFKFDTFMFLLYFVLNFIMLFTNFLNYLNPIFQILGKDATLSGRTFLWRGVLKTLHDNYLLGNGMRSILYDKTFFYMSSAPYFHNSLITVLYRGGILSLLVYTLILTYVFLSIKKIKSNYIRNISFFTFIICIYLSLFDTIDFACLYFIFSLIVCYGLKSRGIISFRNKRIERNEE